jgi:hypothetical protein
LGFGSGLWGKQGQPRTSSPQPSPPFHGGEGVKAKHGVKVRPGERSAVRTAFPLAFNFNCR